MSAISVTVQVLNPEMKPPKNCIIFGLVTNIGDIVEGFGELRKTLRVAICAQMDTLVTLGRGVYVPNHGFLTAEDMKGLTKNPDMTKLEAQIDVVIAALDSITLDDVEFSEQFDYQGVLCRAGAVVITTNVDLEAARAAHH